MSSILGQYTPAHLDKAPWMFGSTKVGGRRRKCGKSRRHNKSVKNITRKRRPRIYNKTQTNRK
jgi:hypothetical protein